MKKALELLLEYQGIYSWNNLSIEICTDKSGYVKELDGDILFEFYSIKNLKKKLQKKINRTLTIAC